MFLPTRFIRLPSFGGICPRVLVLPIIILLRLLLGRRLPSSPQILPAPAIIVQSRIWIALLPVGVVILAALLLITWYLGVVAWLRLGRPGSVHLRHHWL